MFGHLPLTSLRAMEALVRTGSMRDAAYELSVTPGAVSRQIRELEGLLGVKLFERGSGGWNPTARGQTLATAVGAALRSIRFVVDGLPLQDAVALRIGVSRALATYVIAPRLSEFLEEFPSISVYLQGDRLGERPSSDLDLVVRYAIAESMPGLTIIPLPKGTIFPAASPALLGESRPSGPELWPRAPILSFLPHDHWAEWQRATHQELPQAPSVHFSDSTMQFEALAFGAGLSLAHSLLCHQMLKDGNIVPIGKAIETELGYFGIVTSHRTRELDAFVEWLASIMKDAEQTAAGFLLSGGFEPGA